MLSILGIGIAYPEDLSAPLTPTQLGARALLNALEMARIPKESLNLIIGDSSTPFETCPSEGQRIAGNLGLKIPCFDIVGGTHAFPIFLDQISKWSDDKTPDYVAFVSTNMAKDLAEPDNKRYFCDAAGAVILSTRIRGKLDLKTVQIERTNGNASAITIGKKLIINTNIVLQDDALTECILRSLVLFDQVLSAERAHLFVIPPPFFDRQGIDLFQKAGIPSDRILRMPRKSGFALGSSSIIALHSALSSLRSGDCVLLLSALDAVENSRSIFTVN